jgi:hypothetical protein
MLRHRNLPASKGGLPSSLIKERGSQAALAQLAQALSGVTSPFTWEVALYVADRVAQLGPHARLQPAKQLARQPIELAQAEQPALRGELHLVHHFVCAATRVCPLKNLCGGRLRSNTKGSKGEGASCVC